MVGTETLTYRLLQPDEYERVRSIFQAWGADVPRPDLSAIAVAEEDGEIVGFLTLQPILHMEPMWIKPGHRVYWPRLVNKLEDVLRQVAGATYYVFAEEDSDASRAAKAAGLELSPYRVWFKKLGGK